jgi:hypothetical protein
VTTIQVVFGLVCGSTRVCAKATSLIVPGVEWMSGS